jgi:hypothetical protein
MMEAVTTSERSVSQYLSAYMAQQPRRQSVVVVVVVVVEFRVLLSDVTFTWSLKF